MKRSEVLLEISYILDMERDNLSSPDLAKLILNTVEGMGMKPKGYYGIMATGEKYDQEKHQGRDVEYFHYWEREE